MSDGIDSALPPLPDLPEGEALRDAAEDALQDLGGALQRAERATITAMAPYERHLREARSRLAVIATERRRRERALQVAQRASVRDAAKSGDMPSFEAALAGQVELPGDTPLTALHVFLRTGGEVGLGFATRPGVLAFTDGRQQRQARTWGDARAAYEDGWEPGTPGIPGVRVHLSGSRVERVVPASDVVVQAAG